LGPGGDQWEQLGTKGSTGNHCDCGPLRTTVPTSGTVLKDLGPSLPAQVCADPGGELGSAGDYWEPLGTTDFWPIAVSPRNFPRRLFTVCSRGLNMSFRCIQLTPEGMMTRREARMF
jgi:hypothetical protein